MYYVSNGGMYLFYVNDGLAVTLYLLDVFQNYILIFDKQKNTESMLCVYDFLTYSVKLLTASLPF